MPGGQGVDVQGLSHMLPEAVAAVAAPCIKPHAAGAELAQGSVPLVLEAGRALQGRGQRGLVSAPGDLTPRQQTTREAWKGALTFSCSSLFRMLTVISCREAGGWVGDGRRPTGKEDLLVVRHSPHWHTAQPV